MRFYWLIVGILAVWRVTHFFVAEDGPWLIAARLRRRAGDGFFAELLDCFYCLSLWIAIPIAWITGDDWLERVLLWLATSAGAILLERATSREIPDPPAIYQEDEEVSDGMLRTEPTAAGRSGRAPFDAGAATGAR